jgi:hypothetical protein
VLISITGDMEFRADPELEKEIRRVLEDDDADEASELMYILDSWTSDVYRHVDVMVLDDDGVTVLFDEELLNVEELHGGRYR